jgi:hypothetical protein
MPTLTDDEIVALAKKLEPQVWALDPPDISSAQHREWSVWRTKKAALIFGFSLVNPPKEATE